MKALLHLFVLTLAFVGSNAIEKAQTSKREIIIVPKDDYDNKDRRLKYGTSTILEDKLVKDDCDKAYALRAYMKPTKTTFHVAYPTGLHAADDQQGRIPILVISSGKVPTLPHFLTSSRNPASNTNGEFVLWYSPYRPERDTRFIYIMVHHKEAADYAARLTAKVGTLGGDDQAKFRNKVRIVSCRINSEVAAEQVPVDAFYGFGLNRYCGMAFMKKQGIEKFWMVDDNLITISKIEDKLTGVEAKLTGDIAVIGFKSADATPMVNTALNEGGLNLQNMAAIMASQTCGPGTEALHANVEVREPEANEFLEQLYLFNTAKLDAGAPENHFRSFSPKFLSSKEDMTFSYDLFYKNKQVRFLSGEARLYKAFLTKPDAELAAPNPFNPDKSTLKTKTKNSDMLLKYTNRASWATFLKNVGQIGKTTIAPGNDLNDAQAVAPSPVPVNADFTEPWFETASKTQEVLMYKCAVAAKKNLFKADAKFEPDPEFTFGTAVIDPVTYAA